MNKKIEKIVKRVAKEEEGVNAAAVKAALFIVTNWTREKMKQLEYPAILWPKLGSFNVIEERCPEEDKEALREFRNNFKRQE